MKKRETFKQYIKKTVRKSMAIEGYEVETSSNVAKKVRELKTRYVIQVSSS